MAKSPFSPFKALPPRPPSVAIDRLGKMIEPGHLILFHNDEDLIFEVLDVRPVLNPGVPDGAQAIQVMLKAEFPVAFLAAQPNRAMVIIGESQARVAARAENNGKVETAQDAPTGLVLTDGPREIDDAPEETPSGEGQCPACEHEGPVGVVCAQCGDAQYRPPQE